MDGRVELFKTLGMDVEPTMKRFCGDAALLEEMLREFTQESYSAGMEGALESQDFKKLEHVMHTAKGTSASLGFPELSALFDDGVQAIRRDELDDIETLVDAARDSYAKICEGIVQTLG